MVCCGSTPNDEIQQSFYWFGSFLKTVLPEKPRASALSGTMALIAARVRLLVLRCLFDR
jgi:hypothetical protein